MKVITFKHLAGTDRGRTGLPVFSPLQCAAKCELFLIKLTVRCMYTNTLTHWLCSYNTDYLKNYTVAYYSVLQHSLLKTLHCVILHCTTIQFIKNITLCHTTLYHNTVY
jgi:hypothetical protein